jgi:hypothetical protein
MMMRVVLVVIAALTTLGLAAFGVIAAQQAAGPTSLIALVAHLISPGQSSGAAPPPTQPVPAPPVQRSADAPVAEVAQTTITSQVDAPAPARNSAPVPAAPAPSAAPTPPAAKAIPACDNPDAIGLSRVVEIDTTGGPAFGTDHF